MKTVLELSIKANNELKKYDDLVNTDSFNAIEKFNDIWNDAHAELCEAYSLPAFHLWEDGFYKGDAYDNEIVESVNSINAVADPMHHDWNPDPAVWCEENDETEELETNVFDFLDEKFVEIVEPKLDMLIKQYENEYKEEARENREQLRF
jgi:hypothetical protein